MNTKTKNYLMALGLVTDKDTVRHEHLGLALRLLKTTNVSNKAHNRFTGRADTLASLMEQELGKSHGYVTKEMAVWLERFRGAYDPTKANFTDICEQKMVEIITPWQLLYLVSLDFYQKLENNAL